MPAPSPCTSPILSPSPAGSGMSLTLKTPDPCRLAAHDRKPTFDDISNEEFQFLELNATPWDPNTYYKFRRPNLFVLVFTTVFVVMTILGWTVWVYFYTKTRVWPLPRGPLNASDGLMRKLAIVTRVFIVVVGLVLLLAPLVFFMRTRVPGRRRTIRAFTGWIALCFGLGVIPLLIYFITLCSMQYEAYSKTCAAGEEITAYFQGSPHGLNGNGTTATLYRTTKTSHLIATFILTRTGYGAADFTFAKGEITYFRVSYTINADDESIEATSYTSAPDTGGTTATNVTTAIGNLNSMTLSPLNTTLRGVGEVLDRPVNFRLVENPDLLPNGTVDGLGTIGGDVVLRSLATDPWNCSKLKLCAKSIDGPDNMARVFIPMGWALYKHAEYSFSC